MDFADKTEPHNKLMGLARPSKEMQNEDGSPALVGDVIPVWNVDICRNVFLAKTEMLKTVPWDENLKLCFEQNTPIIIKDKTNKIQIIPIKYLFYPSIQSNIYYGYKYGQTKIWTKNGWKKIICISRKKTKEQIYEIRTERSLIKLTENHPIIINNKKIKAKDLSIGDIIENCEFPKLSNKLNIDIDWAWMLGFFLAEGTCLSGIKKQKRVEFTNQNKNFLKKCEYIFNKIGIKCKWYINKTRKDKCYFLRIFHPKLLSDYFSYFYKNNEKIIPYFVYDFDQNARKAFLKGFFDGDGTKFPKKPVILSQKSPSIMNGIIWLTSDLYKNYYINNQKNKYGEWLKLHLKEYKTKLLSNKILNIKTYLTKELVYDLECEGHKFIAGVGNINVHNCEHEDEFIRIKQAGYKGLWTNYIVVEKMTDRPTEYAELRKQNWNKCQKLLLKKWGLRTWIRYVHLNEVKDYYVKLQQNPTN
ncbi:MAG: LAGLIDADG family homing endonuclease [Lutibacter sp.]